MKLINDIKLSYIMAASTSMEKMRCVYEFLQTAKGKAKFFDILKKHESDLVDSLYVPGVNEVKN